MKGVRFGSRRSGPILLMSSPRFGGGALPTAASPRLSVSALLLDHLLRPGAADRDLLRLDLGRLRNVQLQDAVDVLGRDRVAVDALRHRQRADERAVRALREVRL